MASYLYMMYSNEIHPIAWTISHCVLVLKLIGMCISVCVCWVMYWRMRGKMVKRGENRLWEAFCPLHMHTITQSVCVCVCVCVCVIR